MKNALLKLGNWLYKNYYTLYYPLYTIYKAIIDRRERQLLKNFISPGMTVVDVGANIGIYTRYLSKAIGPRGFVHAFEPALMNFERLKKNTYSLPNVVLNQAAVGSYNGMIGLYLSENLNVDHQTFDSGGSRNKVEVPICSLDNYFAPGQKVDLIKIDVQGFELHVLQGAQRILNENSEIKILMEFWPYGLAKASTSIQDLVSFIHSLNFKMYKTTDTLDQSFFDYTVLDLNNINDYVNVIMYK